MNKPLIRLMAGFRRFREKYFVPDHLEDSIYHRLANSGQTPKTLLIGCSDSRVDPAILTGAHPGELFTVRNVANLIPPCEPSAVGFHGTSSAIEFAVEGLKVENIIILGHRQCGGIRALMTAPADDKNPSFVNQWMSIAKDARTAVLAKHGHEGIEAQVRYAEMEALKVSVRNVKTFPFVQAAIDSRQLNIVAVYFDLEQGQLWELDEASDSFRLLEI